MMMDCVEIEEVIKRTKGHFFKEDTMRFFNSRTSQLAYPYEGGYLFWTSERYRTEPRTYSVRFQYASGQVDTVGEFGEHKTAVRALSKIKTILQKGFPKGFPPPQDLDASFRESFDGEKLIKAFKAGDMQLA